jgi:hypothetical protein
MKENTYNFLKGAKLHLCCSNDDFRPAMNNIYFDEGHAIALDGHILICADLHDISTLSDEDIEKLNGKLLNAASYKELLKYPTIHITDTAIEATKPLGVWGSMDVSFKFTEDTTYPNYKSVLDDIGVPEKEDEQVPKTFNTGLNIKSLKRLADAASPEFVDLRYTSRHGAIEVIFSPIYDVRAIIMPRIPQCEQ